MIAALRFYHAACDRLDDALTVACRARAADMPFQYAIDAASIEASRKIEEEDKKRPRSGLARRNAFLVERSRILRSHRHAVQRSRVVDLRATLALEEARLDFARTADVVSDLAWLVTARHDAWRRYTARLERQAETTGKPVRHYVPPAEG